MGTLFSTTLRPAAHAGRFYEADPQALRRTVTALLADAPRASFCKTPLALLTPHAGYVYSGAVAAAAYRTVQGHAVDRVMILAPTHTSPFTGAALPAHAAFATPLGRVPVDRQAVGELAAHPHFIINDEIHADEHAVEVELPFLQVALAGPFHILPMMLGELPPGGLRSIADRLAELIENRRARGQRWLVVASSDTYHGYDREACRENDRKLIQLLSTMNSEELATRFARQDVMACGWKGLAVTMMLAERLGARQCQVLDHRDSNDALEQTDKVGSSRYVVGYVSAAFQ